MNDSRHAGSERGSTRLKTAGRQKVGQIGMNNHPSRCSSQPAVRSRDEIENELREGKRNCVGNVRRSCPKEQRRFSGSLKMNAMFHFLSPLGFCLVVVNVDRATLAHNMDAFKSKICLDVFEAKIPRK